MIRLTLEQGRKLRRALAQIPKDIPKATARAINRSVQAARTELARQLRAEYHIKHSEILAAARIRQASADQRSIYATINVRGTRRELIQFKILPKPPFKRVPKVLRAAVKKSTAPKPLRGAFVQKGRSSGKYHVLMRTGTARYPIHIKYGPSIPEMAGNPNVKAAVEQRAREILAKRLDHEIGRINQKFLSK